MLFTSEIQKFYPVAFFFTVSNKAISDNDDNKDDDDDATSKDVEVVEIDTGEALTMLDSLVNLR